MPLARGGTVRYPGGRARRAKEGHKIPPVVSPEVEAEKSPVSRLSFRLFRRSEADQPDEDWVDAEEGYETDYDYAPAVVSRYRGRLRPSDDYVDVFEAIEEKGIAALTKSDDANGGDSLAGKIGRKIGKAAGLNSESG
jgi:hypothetical protein